MVHNIRIEKLKTSAYNPRIELKPGMPEYEKLEQSIKDFGNVEPIVWNEKTGNVVGGHQRLSVLRNMGYKEIPCSVVNLAEKDEKLLNLALNKIKGKWDYDKLEALLNEYERHEATASGFSSDELAIILAGNNDTFENLEDWDDWDDGTAGGSYVLTLVFGSQDFAKEWIKKEKLNWEIKTGTKSTVIRMG